MLHESFHEEPGSVMFANSMDTSDIEEIQMFLDESVKGNCEGMVYSAILMVF